MYTLNIFEYKKLTDIIYWQTFLKLKHEKSLPEKLLVGVAKSRKIKTRPQQQSINDYFVIHAYPKLHIFLISSN